MEGDIRTINLAITTALVGATGALSIARKYVETTFSWAERRPKGLVATFVLGAFYFGYNCFQIVFFTDIPMLSTIGAQSSRTTLVLMRSSLVFAGITMLFGPFLVLPPIRKIVLKRDTVFKRIVKGAQKKETRYTALGFFGLLTLIQGFVVFSLWQLLYVELQQELRHVLGIVVGYALVCLFYLVIFYSVMVGKDIVIRGINLMEQIRRNMVIRRRAEGKPDLDLLDNEHYVKGYLAAFVLALAGSGTLTGLIFAHDLPSLATLSTVEQAAVIGFFVVNCITAIVLTIFVLNVAFNPVSLTDVVLPSGKVIRRGDARLRGVEEVTPSVRSTSHIRLVTLARPADRAVLFEQATEGDPDAPALVDRVRLIVRDPRTSTRAGVECVAGTLCLDTDGVDARVHQMNDRACMYFAAVGTSYGEDLARHFLWRLRDLEPLRQRTRGTLTAAPEPDTWTGATAPELREATTALMTEFGDPQREAPLREEAAKMGAQRARDQEAAVTADRSVAGHTAQATAWAATAATAAQAELHAQHTAAALYSAAAREEAREEEAALQRLELAREKRRQLRRLKQEALEKAEREKRRRMEEEREKRKRAMLKERKLRERAEQRERAEHRERLKGRQLLGASQIRQLKEEMETMRMQMSAPTGVAAPELELALAAAPSPHRRVEDMAMAMPRPREEEFLIRRTSAVAPAEPPAIDVPSLASSGSESSVSGGESSSIASEEMPYGTEGFAAASVTLADGEVGGEGPADEGTDEDVGGESLEDEALMPVEEDVARVRMDEESVSDEEEDEPVRDEVLLPTEDVVADERIDEEDVERVEEAKPMRDEVLLPREKDVARERIDEEDVEKEEEAKPMRDEALLPTEDDVTGERIDEESASEGEEDERMRDEVLLPTGEDGRMADRVARSGAIQPKTARVMEEDEKMAAASKEYEDLRAQVEEERRQQAEAAMQKVSDALRALEAEEASAEAAGRASKREVLRDKPHEMMMERLRAEEMAKEQYRRRREEEEERRKVEQEMREEMEEERELELHERRERESMKAKMQHMMQQQGAQQMAVDEDKEAILRRHESELARLESSLGEERLALQKRLQDRIRTHQAKRRIRRMGPEGLARVVKAQAWWRGLWTRRQLPVYREQARARVQLAAERRAALMIQAEWRRALGRRRLHVLARAPDENAVLLVEWCYRRDAVRAEHVRRRREEADCRNVGSATQRVGLVEGSLAVRTQLSGGAAPLGWCHAPFVVCACDDATRCTVAAPVLAGRRAASPRPSGDRTVRCTVTVAAGGVPLSLSPSGGPAWLACRVVIANLGDGVVMPSFAVPPPEALCASRTAAPCGIIACAVGGCGYASVGLLFSSAPRDPTAGVPMLRAGDVIDWACSMDDARETWIVSFALNGAVVARRRLAVAAFPRLVPAASFVGHGAAVELAGCWMGSARPGAAAVWGPGDDPGPPPPAVLAALVGRDAVAPFGPWQGSSTAACDRLWSQIRDLDTDGKSPDALCARLLAAVRGPWSVLLRGAAPAAAAAAAVPLLDARPLTVDEQSCVADVCAAALHSAQATQSEALPARSGPPKIFFPPSLIADDRLTGEDEASIIRWFHARDTVILQNPSDTPLAFFITRPVMSGVWCFQILANLEETQVGWGPRACWDAGGEPVASLQRAYLLKWEDEAVHVLHAGGRVRGVASTPISSPVHVVMDMDAQEIQFFENRRVIANMPLAIGDRCMYPALLLCGRSNAMVTLRGDDEPPRGRWLADPEAAHHAELAEQLVPAVSPPSRPGKTAPLPRRQLSEMVLVPGSEVRKEGIMHLIGKNGGGEIHENPALTRPPRVRAERSSECEGRAADAAGHNRVLSMTDSLAGSWQMFDITPWRWKPGAVVQVAPSHYSITHGQGCANDLMRSWVLEGSSDGQAWVTLSEHSQDESLDGRWASVTWAITPPGPPCSYFRVRLTGPTSSGTHHLCMCGFEVYGQVSTRQLEGGMNAARLAAWQRRRDAANEARARWEADWDAWARQWGVATRAMVRRLSTHLVGEAVAGRGPFAVTEAERLRWLARDGCPEDAPVAPVAGTAAQPSAGSLGVACDIVRAAVEAMPHPEVAEWAALAVFARTLAALALAPSVADAAGGPVLPHAVAVLGVLRSMGSSLARRAEEFLVSLRRILTGADDE